MEKIKSFSPLDGKCIGERNKTTQEEIQNMVEKAHQAQLKWGQLSVLQRGEYIKKVYQKIKDKEEDFANLIHKEMGKTLQEAHGEVQYYTGQIDRLITEIDQALAPEFVEDEKTKTTLYRDPLGVCASITPWNFPLGMPHSLMIPSLLAGNTVLFKPSEETFLVGELYAQCLQEFLPQNVLQLVIGNGQQGQWLVESDVQLITFTGSQGTGKKILTEAGRGLKRVILELGGKDPLIVLEDADIDAAAKFAARNSCRNSGQVCVSTEKIYVLESINDEFLKKLKENTEKMKLGPMIHHKQKEHVVNQVESAVAQGAKVYYGDLNKSDDNYFSPMILTDLSPDMSIMKDETFGPIACVTKVKNIQEAIELANQGTFGLGGAVFGTDKNKAKEVARKLNSGMVGINQGPGGAQGSPWVGAKQSGYGLHGHKEGHRQFTQLRTVSESK